MKSKDFRKYTISYPDYKNFIGILTSLYKQTKEFINPLFFFITSKEKVADFNYELFAKSIFKGNHVILPRFNIIDPSIEKYNRFEEFTKKDEVNNIALWVLATLKYYSTTNSLLIGKELEILQTENPRDGRLDVVALKENRALIIETKTDLRSALVENRFLYQIPNYEKECINIMKQYKAGGDPLMLLCLGGEETDLFPPDHNDCTTGKVGNIAKIFYDKISEKNIKFISANALWCIATYSYANDKKIDLFDLIFSIFFDKKIIGLLSAGVVSMGTTGPIIQPLDITRL